MPKKMTEQEIKDQCFIEMVSALKAIGLRPVIDEASFMALVAMRFCSFMKRNARVPSNTEKEYMLSDTRDVVLGKKRGPLTPDGLLPELYEVSPKFDHDAMLRQLSRVAYDVLYPESPPWDSLPETKQARWCHAVEALIKEYSSAVKPEASNAAHA